LEVPAGKRELQQNIDEEISAGKLFVPVLFLAFFSTWIIESLTGIFQIEIASTFFGSPNPVSLATTGQLVTISGVVSIVFGLLLGVLSVRYNLKRLLLLGVATIALGTMGCFLAPNFLFMQIFYPVEGIGTIIVSSMSFALVGEFLVLSKRPKATGWVIAGGTIAGLVSSFVISLFFSGADGWRSYLLWFALPISLLSLAAVYFGVPSAPRKQKPDGKEAYFRSFKQVFLKKSAAGCLIGCMFRMTIIGFGFVYSASFFREKFGLSLASAALLVSLAVLAFYSIGSILGGHLVNRVGRKRLLVATLAISSPFLLLLAFIPEQWVALALFYVFNLIYSLSNAPSVSLTIEQAPESRGTMMSMMTIFTTLGTIMAAALGGIALVLSGWIGVILTFVALQLISVAIFFFLTKDPCQA
jgi:predicted MFS family arabinose efflux permease